MVNNLTQLFDRLIVVKDDNLDLKDPKVVELIKDFKAFFDEPNLSGTDKDIFYKAYAMGDFMKMNQIAKILEEWGNTT